MRVMVRARVRVVVRVRVGLRVRVRASRSGRCVASSEEAERSFAKPPD